MSVLALHDIQKSYASAPILRGIDLRVRDGELVVLVGPSGCGKSTLLRTIAGLESPERGRIEIAGRDVTDSPPKDRDIGMVFQSYALYPHLTVRENLAFGLKLRRTEPRVVEERVQEAARMLGLEALLERMPRQLSGGQRQRVAMGRAIARRPRIFLFDEPLSNLDAALRSEVRLEIKQLHERLGATMIYVTHDQVEAMTLADRLVVLRDGEIEQEGPPLEVYERPKTRFVASFLGSPGMSFLEASIAGGILHGQGFSKPMLATSSEGPVVVGLRAHDVRVSDTSADLVMKVDVIEAMGAEAFAHGSVGGAKFVTRVELSDLPRVRAGSSIHLSILPERLRLFDESTGKARAA
jgi:sn-glycerol 3-phosphate transport system ATP-binding protein/multiple sugar transport system ATP-binding protein